MIFDSKEESVTTDQINAFKNYFSNISSKQTEILMDLNQARNDLLKRIIFFSLLTMGGIAFPLTGSWVEQSIIHQLIDIGVGVIFFFVFLVHWFMVKGYFNENFFYQSFVEDERFINSLCDSIYRSYLQSHYPTLYTLKDIIILIFFVTFAVFHVYYSAYLMIPLFLYMKVTQDEVHKHLAKVSHEIQEMEKMKYDS